MKEGLVEVFQLCFKSLSVAQLRIVEESLKKKKVNNYLACNITKNLIHNTQIRIPSEEVWKTHCEKEYGEKKKVKNASTWEETFRVNFLNFAQKLQPFLNFLTKKILELAQQEKLNKFGSQARNIVKQAELIKQKSGVKTLSPQTARATATIAKSRSSGFRGSSGATSSHHRDNNIYNAEARKKLFSKIGSKR